MQRLETSFCKVSGPVSTMKLCGLVHDLKSSALLEHTASRLTPRLQERWLSYERGLPPGTTPETFVEWLQAVLSEKIQTSWTSATSTVAPTTRERKRHTVRTTAVSGSVMSECCICRNGKHQTKLCPRFLNMTLQRRTEEVSRNGLCLRCLQKGHRQRDCPKSHRCTEEGCQAYHHQLMHGAPRLVDVATSVQRRANQTSGEADRVNVGLASHQAGNDVICAIVPVVVQGNGRQVRSFALLDSGSEVSLISERLAQQTGLSGPPHYLQLRTVTGETSVAARRTTCEISSLDGSSRFQLRQALVIPNLHFGTRIIRLPKIKEQWNHLKEICFPVTTLERVEMLLRIDAPLAHRYFDVKVSSNTQTAPVGVLTPFGWAVIGRLPNARPTTERQEEEKWIRRQVMHGTDHLEELMKRFLDADPLVSPSVPGRLTIDERIALDILESTTRFDGERYVIGLLWSSSSIELPCNRAYALKRFSANERRLLKDTDAASRYAETMHQYIHQGHAKRVRFEERGTAGRIWYLPHHGVWSTQRTKLRVVFEASAKYHGTSLNQCLLKGPDYLPNLCGVLLRFRRKRVPVSADIERMYHQVKVREEDRSSLRFFWRPPGSAHPPQTYEMQVHVFGATSSPCVCMYALRRAALDNSAKYPEALGRMSNIYVDNWLESFDSIEEARKTCAEMKDLLSNSSFHLRKWATTMPKLLSDVPHQDLSDAMVRMPFTSSAAENTLGLIWDCRDDVFYFSFKAPLPMEPSKREMLSCIARLFGPLGLLSPVVITARVLVQDMWKTRCDWDEVPAEPLLMRWKQWTRNLLQIGNITFPRCLCSQFDDVAAHIFCDASESAYGAAASIFAARAETKSRPSVLPLPKSESLQSADCPFPAWNCSAQSSPYALRDC